MNVSTKTTDVARKKTRKMTRWACFTKNNRFAKRDDGVHEEFPLNHSFLFFGRFRGNFFLYPNIFGFMNAPPTC